MATPISFQHHPHDRSLSDKLARAWAYVGYGMQMLPPMLLPIFPNRDAIREVTTHDRVVRYYRHWPACPKLLRDWDTLSVRVPGATAFQSPPWQSAIARFADSLGRLRLITVHQGDRLLAVVPLERNSRNEWRTPGQLTTDYLQPLVDPDQAAGTWRAILDAIRAFSGDSLDSISFELVARDSAFREQLSTLPASTGFRVVDEVVSNATVIPLAATWDAYLAKLDGHDRKELRRKIRKAEEKGGAQLVTSTSPLSIEHSLKDVFSLMEANGGGKGRKAKWLFRPHFRAAAPALGESGRLIVYQLFLGHRHAASVIALPTHTHQILWCGAMDHALCEWSPGIVLFGMIFRQAIAKGQTQIDLLRGQYPYKYALGGQDVPLHRLTLVNQKKC